MAKVPKTIEYRRVRWLAEDMNLETLARDAWNSFDTQVGRTVERPGGARLAGTKCRDEGQWGFAVQCVRYVDGQAVGTVSMLPAVEIDLGERPPEPNENYLNSGFFALIRGNEVICLDCGQNGASLRNFLSDLFLKAEFPDKARQFELVRMGNAQKLALIERVGVKQISLNIGLGTASADALAEQAPSGLWGKLGKGLGDTISALRDKDGILNKLSSSTEGVLTLSIKIPKGDLLAAKEGVAELAEIVSDDESAEDYLIVLTDNTQITPTEMTTRKPVRIQAYANSVSTLGAWDEMKLFMQELVQSRATEV